MREADIQRLVAYRNDPSIGRFQDWELPFTDDAARRLIDGQAALHGPTSGEWVQLAVDLGDVVAGDVAVELRAGGAIATIGCTFGAGCRSGRSRSGCRPTACRPASCRSPTAPPLTTSPTPRDSPGRPGGSLRCIGNTGYLVGNHSYRLPETITPFSPRRSRTSSAGVGNAAPPLSNTALSSGRGCVAHRTTDDQRDERIARRSSDRQVTRRW